MQPNLIINIIDMATQNFEDILNNITKPEVPELKHEAMLSKIIIKAKSKSVVSLWWLCIPLYIIAALLMKSFYVQGTSLISNLHQLTDSKSYTSVLLFIVLPVLFIIINVLSIKQLFFLYSSLTKTSFLKLIAVHVFIILLSLLVLLIYFL